MELHGKNIIGAETSAQGDATIQAVNPATGQTLEPLFHEAAPSEVDDAARRAHDAAPQYARRSPEDRARFLEAIAEEIENLGDALIERAGAETGLPQARLTGERGRTANQLRAFAALVREGSWVDARIDRAMPDRAPLPKPDLRAMLVPIGPVAVFGASNFPLAFSVAGGDAASALAAGNPIVVKAHPAHPGTSEMVARAIATAAEKSETPAGVFSMLHGKSPETSLRLVRCPLIRAVGFTGSHTAGRALFDAAAARPEPIPVYAEMGSVNPVFVLPQALSENPEGLAEGLCQSLTLGVGQFCTQPGLVVGIDDADFRRFTTKLAECVEKSSPGTMLHAGILESYETGLKQLEETPGVEAAASSAQEADPSKTQATVALFSVDAATFLENPALAQEVFGPATIAIACETAEQMEDVAASLSGQLTATLHAQDADIARFPSLVETLKTKAGRLVFNGFPTGVEVCPSMIHGGPYPATTDARTTSVGTAAILRFARPVCLQDAPQDALPPELQDKNSRGIWRLLDNEATKDDA